MPLERHGYAGLIGNLRYLEIKLSLLDKLNGNNNLNTKQVKKEPNTLIWYIRYNQLYKIMENPTSRNSLISRISEIYILIYNRTKTSFLPYSCISMSSLNRLFQIWFFFSWERTRLKLLRGTKILNLSTFGGSFVISQVIVTHSFCVKIFFILRGVALN